MGLTVEDFSQICRACLCESTDMKPLFTKLNEDRSLLILFNFTVNLSATLDDALPKQICNECETVLYETEEFRKKCLASDALLKNIVVNSIHEDETKLFMDKTSGLEVQVNETIDIESSSNKINTSIKLENEDLSDREIENDFSNEPLEPVELKEEITSDIKVKNKEKANEGVFSNVTYQFSCKVCNIPFNDLTAWENHLKNHPLKNENKHPTQTNNTLLFQCSMCFRRCKTKKTLSKHMKLHQDKDNVKYSCDKCKREFKYKSFLESHVISVHMHNNFICHLCSEKFDSKDSLETHLDSHKEKNKHCCTICGKAFRMLCTLTDHMRKHTGEKPFLCSTCGKGFSQKTNLAQHTRRHLGVKPFKCNICSKGFVSKGELDAHTRKHSGAHPFVCDDCGNGFTTSSSLGKHRRTHTGERPYACDLCPMRFTASGTLKNHRRTHTGERPFQCSLCDKAFVQRTDLISHIRCHTGERPYICSHCGQAFRKAAGLKTHLKMHGKDGMQGNVLLNIS